MAYRVRAEALIKIINAQAPQVALDGSILILVHLRQSLLIAATAQFTLCSPCCRRPYTDTAELRTATEDPAINYTGGRSHHFSTSN